MKINHFRFCCLLAALCALAACKKNEPDVAPAKSFSVGPGSYVYFAPGNLQYQPSTQTWRFAENAYAMSITNANPNAESEKWMDLFGWGTSGWNSGASAYQPYSTSSADGDYQPAGRYDVDLTGEFAKADWGSVEISNADPGVQWRTLTAKDWKYLIKERPRCDSLATFATIGKIPGLILFPDDWDWAYWSEVLVLSLKSFADNKITEDYWPQLETAGAVFLPAGGQRNGVSPSSAKKVGYYWSTTHIGRYGAYCFVFSTSEVNPEAGKGRQTGESVRLVRPAK